MAATSHGFRTILKFKKDFRMSKCQRGKFFAGGKAGAGCGPSGPSGGSSGPNNLGSDMAALLAARDAQDRAWTTPATTNTSQAIPQKATPALTQLALVQAQPANYKQMSKEEMMNIICARGGDMSDED